MAIYQATNVSKNVIPVLVNNLQEENEDFRVRVMELLEDMGSQALTAHDALSKLVNEGESAYVRVKAARALYSIDPTNTLTVPAILAGLKANDPGARFAAASTAQLVGEAAQDVVPALIQALKDKDKGVRYGVAAALGAMGPSAKAAIPALEAVLKDDADFVRQMASSAMKRIKGDK
jgi:HEAT repeat protein